MKFNYLRVVVVLGLAQLDAVLPASPELERGEGASEACDQAVLAYCAGANERSNEEMRRLCKS